MCTYCWWTVPSRKSQASRQPSFVPKTTAEELHNLATEIERRLEPLCKGRLRPIAALHDPDEIARY